MKIRDNLLNAIKSQGKTQKEFAQGIGVPTSTVNNWIKLERSIPAERIIPICEFLHITPYYLLTGTDSHPLHDSVTIGNQSPMITNSTNIEVTGIKHSNSEEPLSEITGELVNAFDQLPIKEKIRLMNYIYDYVDKYQQNNSK